MQSADDENARLRSNNVTPLRLLLALIICVGHGAQLAGGAVLEPIADTLSSPYRISAFFVLSGFLIFRSYERSQSPSRFALKRVRRIYPPYAAVVLLCAVGLSAVSSRSLSDYFSADWLRYVAANLAFLGFIQPTLPGVFDDNVRPEINGAVWTLKIEVMFYMTVPVFAWMFRRAGRLPVMIAAYALSVLYVGVLSSLAWTSNSGVSAMLARQFPGQLAYLMAGACFYYYFPVVDRHVRSVVVASLAVLVLNVWLPLAPAEPLALAGLVIAVAFFTPALGIERLQNLSYMLFIVHFPIAQLLASGPWARQSPFAYLLALVTISIAAASALDCAVRCAFPPPQRRPAAIPTSVAA